MYTLETNGSHYVCVGYVVVVVQDFMTKRNSMDLLLLELFHISLGKGGWGHFTPPNCIAEQALIYTIFSAHANGGLAPGSAHRRPSARPLINMSGNFLAPVSAESPSNISPNPSEVISEVSEP